MAAAATVMLINTAALETTLDAPMTAPWSHRVGASKSPDPFTLSSGW